MFEKSIGVGYSNVTLVGKGWCNFIKYNIFITTRSQYVSIRFDVLIVFL